MHAWEAIRKTLNYVEEHIGAEISIDELAQIASLSPFYYQRLFTRLVKKPVREYIKTRQLARACNMLCDKENRIMDVALKYGFGSHETFTRAFKDTYGITPAQYRDKPVALDHFDKPDLLLNYVIVDEGVPLISDGLVLEMNRKALDKPICFAGKKGFFPFVPGKMLGERPGVSAADDIWRAFFSVQQDIPRIPGGRHIGVCFKGDAPDGHTSYFAGAEVEQIVANARYEHWQLPVREYVVCGFEAEDFEQLAPSALGKAMKFTRLWLKNHGLTADGFFPEMYYPNALDTPYMELWIPFRQREKKYEPEELS